MSVSSASEQEAWNSPGAPKKKKPHGRNIDGFVRACFLSLQSRNRGKQNNTKENYCPKLPLLGNKAGRVSVTSDILRWLFERYSFVGKDRVDLYLNPKWWHYLSGSRSIQADKTSQQDDFCAKKEAGAGE